MINLNINLFWLKELSQCFYYDKKFVTQSKSEKIIIIVNGYVRIRANLKI